MNIIQMFASPGWGGGEKYAYELSVRLLREGNNVHIVSRRSPVISRKAHEIGVEHTQLPMKGAFDVVSALRLAGIIRRTDAKILHAHNFKDAFTAVYANILTGGKCKVVLTRHLVRKGKTGVLYNWLYKQIDHIVFVSELARNEFLSTVSSVPSEKISVLYNCVNVTESVCDRGSVDLRTKYRLLPGAFIFGYTGRVVPEKGVDILIEALERMTKKDAAIVVIGTADDSYADTLRQLADRCGVADRVFLYGYAEGVFDLIAQTDAGVLPTIAKEAFGLSVIEFMYCAKPVITTDNGAQREYINDSENGLLVPPSDIEALAAAMDRVAEDAQLRRKLSENARNTFDELFSYDVFYKNMTDIYRR